MFLIRLIFHNGLLMAHAYTIGSMPAPCAHVRAYCLIVASCLPFSHRLSAIDNAIDIENPGIRGDMKHVDKEMGY